LAFAIVGEQTPVGAKPLTLYVATNGNDTWSGQLAKPSVDAKDGPLATLSAALRTVRNARQGSAAVTDAVTILLRGGTYFLAEPITLTPEDSGARAKQLFTIAAYQHEKPVLSGGRRITGWQPAHRPGLWLAAVPDVREGRWYFRSLFINGERKQRA